MPKVRAEGVASGFMDALLPILAEKRKQRAEDPEAKLQRDIRLEQEKARAESLYPKPEIELLRSILGGSSLGSSGDSDPARAASSGFRPTKLSLGGVTLERPASEIAMEEGQQAATKKEFENAEKLAGAIRQMSVLENQFQKAFPDKGRSPIEQRILGGGEALLAKLGLVNNPEALALVKNARLFAIQLIRSFGEVGNLSQTEQQSAIDAVSQAGLTADERMATVAQIAELALGRLSGPARSQVMKDPEIASIVERFGIDFGNEEAKFNEPAASSGFRIISVEE